MYTLQFSPVIDKQKNKFPVTDKPGDKTAYIDGNSFILNQSRSSL